MICRSLLVLLDTTAGNAERMRCAIALAQALDAHLVGLAPTDLIDLPAVPRAAASLQETAARVWDALRDQAERAADAFRDACRAAGLDSFEAVIDAADRAASVLRHAHCSDLTVLTQAGSAGVHAAADRSLVESVILHSARPTLVLPAGAHTATLGTRVLIAWDDSREATRALADALPLLQRAAQVHLVAWTGSIALHGDALGQRLDAVRQWLLRHGVTARTRVEALRAGGIADAIRTVAADAQADLIVMGAYGRTRLAELVLGSATRGLLAATNAPLLMSH